MLPITPPKTNHPPERDIYLAKLTWKKIKTTKLAQKFQKALPEGLS